MLDTTTVDNLKPLLDSGYLSSPNTNDSSREKFCFDNKCFVEFSNQSSTSKLNVPETVGVSSMELHLQNGAIYRRRRSFSDPFPCSTKSLSSHSFAQHFVGQHDLLSLFSNQSVQTCYYCNAQNDSAHCALCVRSVTNGSNLALTQRPIAIITPFRKVNLLNVTDDDLRPLDTVIDNIASRLRAISDDFDQRYGAANVVGVNLNAAAFGNIILAVVRGLVVAFFARLVGL